MRSSTLLVLPLPLLALLLCRCSEDQQEWGLAAERSYVDLLYALQSGDTTASRATDSSFNESIRHLRRLWYRPRAVDELDDMRYHVDLAECAYEDARAAIEEGELDRAIIHLDRAVYQLQAGDRASLDELYVGSIYDFVGSWLEVDYLLRERGSQADYHDFRECVRYALLDWRRVRQRRPDAALYFHRGVDPEAFTAAHADLGTKVEAFYHVVRDEQYAAISNLGNEVSEALWELLLLFASTTTEPGPSYGGSGGSNPRSAVSDQQLTQLGRRDQVDRSVLGAQ